MVGQDLHGSAGKLNIVVEDDVVKWGLVTWFSLQSNNVWMYVGSQLYPAGVVVPQINKIQI